MDFNYKKAMSSRHRPSIEDLPENIIIDILSRLPVKTIIHCKCICKKWRNLVLDSYFVNHHLSRSPTGLMIHHVSGEDRRARYYKPGILKWVDILDEPDHHHLQLDPVMNVDLDQATVFQDSQIHQVGSVDGLLCLWQPGRLKDNTYICNPITREYMIIPSHQYYKQGYAIMVYGFGVGLATKEYKVIRTFQEVRPPSLSSTSRLSLLEAEVYTLGTGQWRSLGRVPYRLQGSHGPFLNGRVHWIVDDEDALERVCAFDIDNESFKLFPSPPFKTIDEGGQLHFQTLGVLKGCLCVSDTCESRFTLWVMKEYGMKKSWHKEVVIKEIISPNNPQWEIWGQAYVLEHFKDGTILMVYGEDKLLAYCSGTNIIEDTRLSDPYLTGITYRPSFLKLQDFASESVEVFEMSAGFSTPLLSFCINR